MNGASNRPTAVGHRRDRASWDRTVRRCTAFSRLGNADRSGSVWPVPSWRSSPLPLQALAVRLYVPPDELYHVGYVAMVLDGQLPTLTTSLPVGEVPLAPADGQPRRVYVANHPPLFYAVTAVPVGVGRLLDAPAAGVLAARLVSVSLAAAGVALVAWLAVLLVPGRPQVAVGAAWLAALLPSLPHVSAFVYNDGLGFLAATATLVAAVAVLRRGPALPRLAGLTAASAAAALTRAPGLALVVFAAVAASGGVLLHQGRRRGRQVLAAAGAGAVVAGAAGGAALWFYLRNRSLYGSLSGAAYNQEVFGFVPQNHVPELLRSPAYLLRLYDGLWVWTRFNLPRVPTLTVLVAYPGSSLWPVPSAVGRSSRTSPERPAGQGQRRAGRRWTGARRWLSLACPRMSSGRQHLK
jgi:hypothetical protein